MPEYAATSSNVVEPREAIQSVGKALADFLKSGPCSPRHVPEVQEAIAAIVSSIVTTPETATENYAATCRDFMEKAKQVKGMLARTIYGDGGSDTVSSSGDHIAKKFPALLPSITERFDWCVKNYSVQAGLYLGEQLAQVHALVLRFLETVPVGGCKDKAIRSRIAEIKSELRSLVKWERLFYTYKAMSFPAEVEYIFALEGNPIAAVWHYNSLDEQGEYQKTYSHRERDGHVYVVRRNWAIAKDLMRAGPDGYIDEISRPHQDIGCICHLQWLYAIRDLPIDMVREKGRSELTGARSAIQIVSQAQAPIIPAEPATGRSALRSRLLRWFGWG
jgi:hypothetical protein